MQLSASQIRAGRALLNWSRNDLATKAKVHLHTLAFFEREIRMPNESSIHLLQLTLEAAGIEFLDDNGVRLKP